MLNSLEPTRLERPSKRKICIPLDDFLQSFRSPPVEYRPAPFTILNDEYEPGRGEEQLTRLIESLAGAGFGGAYLHPRPGLITEYLSARWFELIRHCVSECKRVGIIPHLYDENSYPSGFSGGHVSALVPEARSRYVTFLCGKGREALPPVYLALDHWTERAPGAALDRTDVGEDTDWIAFFLQDLAPMAWHGETVYPSLLDPRTTEAFLATTHERYRKELGDLWNCVPSIFTDEPHLPGSTHGPWSIGLHLTPYVMGQFRQRLGYDLESRLGSLFFNVGAFQKIRYDFYDLCHQLWMENWALPLEKWCQDHSIKLTGHYLEHDWPCPYATPGHVHLLAHMDWPGSDMLLGFLLKGHDFFDIQGYEPTPAGAEPHGLYFLRQIHSLANQLDKERIVNESWGAGGSETAPEDWMRIGRWMIVHGVNLLIPHSSWDTIRGGRKADHPPNFAPQSPWFEYLQPLNDELARLCWAANQGECVNRVLLIDSLTSAYCVSRKSESYTTEAMMALADPCFSAEESLPSIRSLKHSAEQFAQNLSEAMVDFDIGDEYVIEEFGSTKRCGLSIGSRQYRWIVLPPLISNLRSATASIVREALARGSHLMGVHRTDFFIDGLPSDFLEKLSQDFPGQVEWCANAKTLQERLIEHVPPRLSFQKERSFLGLAHMHRILEDGEVVLLVNSSREQFSSAATLRTGRQFILRLEPSTGEYHLCPCSTVAGGVEFTVEVDASCTVVLLATDDLTMAKEAHLFEPAQALETLAPPELLGVERLGDNILVVDFCSLELKGKVFPSEAVMSANNRYWRAHGLDTNGWNNIIQYRDQVLARDRVVMPDSGGVVRYEFVIRATVDPQGIRLCVECPELWKVEVNGNRVAFPIQNTFRDPRILWALIGHYLVHGRNEVKLTGNPFTVRQEIDQIYLLGDFACQPAEQGFHLTAPEPLSWGSWKTQGLPFYDAEVSYRIRIPAGTRALQFPREIWGGALLVASRDLAEIGRVYESPWTIDLTHHSFQEVDVRVIGLPINLFGPWHDPNHRWGVANTFMWMGDQVPREPQPGSHYQHIDLGLYGAPIAIR